MKYILLISHLASLILGGIIYLLFRDSSLILFGWIEKLGAGSAIEQIQRSTFPVGTSLPRWILFSLPDGLWLFSYVCLMLHFWGNSLTRTGLFWVFILPVLAICHELLQGFKLMSGTFDPIDLLFYLLASFLPFVLFTKRINFVTPRKTP